MMTKYCFILTAAAAVILPAAAGAAPVGVDREKSVYQLGRCIAGDDRDAAMEMLRSLPLDGETVTVDASQAGRAAKCVGERRELRSITLRGALAQALLLRDFPRFGVPPKIARNHFITFDLPLDATSSGGADPHTASLYRLADCVARNQGMMTERLFRAAPGSGLEGNVLRALGPTMTACQGQRAPIRVGRSDFRSALAQAYYHVSVRYWTDQLWSAS
jgi:hypothetical protein